MFVTNGLDLDDYYIECWKENYWYMGAIVCP